eukprot:gb/GEZN01002991.1/.p1 GENE.gb/GEZN01002991.1/~~gb/GEZN01002991.1/.p1  ORF type:complete len:579 (+),score=116.03 gb/GEZN01002991.1/:39-1775(+)
MTESPHLVTFRYGSEEATWKLHGNNNSSNSLVSSLAAAFQIPCRTHGCLTHIPGLLLQDDQGHYVLPDQTLQTGTYTLILKPPPVIFENFDKKEATRTKAVNFAVPISYSHSYSSDSNTSSVSHSPSNSSSSSLPSSSSSTLPDSFSPTLNVSPVLFPALPHSPASCSSSLVSSVSSSSSSLSLSPHSSLLRFSLSSSDSHALSNHLSVPLPSSTYLASCSEDSTDNEGRTLQEPDSREERRWEHWFLSQSLGNFSQTSPPTSSSWEKQVGLQTDASEVSSANPAGAGGAELPETSNRALPGGGENTPRWAANVQGGFDPIRAASPVVSSSRVKLAEVGDILEHSDAIVEEESNDSGVDTALSKKEKEAIEAKQKELIASPRQQQRFFATSPFQRSLRRLSQQKKEADGRDISLLQQQMQLRAKILLTKGKGKSKSNKTTSSRRRSAPDVPGPSDGDLGFLMAQLEEYKSSPRTTYLRTRPVAMSEQASPLFLRSSVPANPGDARSLVGMRSDDDSISQLSKQMATLESVATPTTTPVATTESVTNGTGRLDSNRPFANSDTEDFLDNDLFLLEPLPF